MGRLRCILCVAAASLSACVLAAGDARAQNIFCPTGFGSQTGIHFEVNECTNGNTGAYSNAALASQAVTDLSQSATQDATKATMAGVSNRRTAEEDRCPEGSTRVGGVCRRNSARAVPFTAEPAAIAGAWPALPDEFLTVTPELQAYARTTQPRMPVKAAQPPSQRSPVAAWMQAYGDYERRSGRAAGTGEFDVLTLDAKSTSKSGGVVGGLDATLHNIVSPGDGFIAGVLVGYASSNLTLQTTSVTTSPLLTPGGFNTLKADLSGPSAGVYASYFNGGFSSDLAFKADFLDLRISTNELLGFGANPALGIVATTVPFSSSGSTRLNSYTASGNLNYKVPVTANLWLQPTVGIQYTKSDYAADAAQFGLDDGYLVRLQGGVRIGVESAWNQTPVAASFTALLYDNVKIRGGLLQTGLVGGNPLILNDQGKIRAQGTLALNFQHGNGISTFLLGEIRGGEDLFGAGGKAGARFTW